MASLDRTLRRDLENAVKKARRIAEAGARQAIEQLAVQNHEPWPTLTDEQRSLRNRLRAHGRQLGDRRDEQKGTQAIDRLVTECAYEHWHRLLFARFLAENDLLIEPESGMALSMDECRELAQERGVNWLPLASGFAQRMLPQIFRVDDPVLEVSLPPETRQDLEKILEGLQRDVFTADDSLGWVYQFWQAEKKDQVNASEVKIGADELPAVTQLFTEDYMVSFLLDNSLGAWWAARRLSEEDLKTAESEEELRRKTAISGVSLAYLRFVREESGIWAPAAGAFDSWPKKLSELKILDPCCGSGHFLVAALLMLVPMRMELEGLTAREAVGKVLSENIHGLELDQRCVELAAFALALAAWKYPGAGGYRPLPELHVACSGLSISAAKEEWKQLALDRQNLRIALDWMHDVFKDAPVLGSLINPARTDAAKLVSWEELSSTLEQALKQEQTIDRQEAAVVAQGLAKAATMLAGKYHLVITNVPYLARGKQIEKLKDFSEENYPAAKNDLATVFLARCLELCVEGGTASIVLPQNWLFLTTYKKFREKLLNSDKWHLIARLGPGAFETISGEVVKAILISLSRGNKDGKLGGLFEKAGPVGIIRGMDVSAPPTAAEKAAGLLTAEMKSVEQAKQLKNPDSRIALEEAEDIELLGKYANAFQGIASADYPRYGRNVCELAIIDGKEWIFQQSTVEVTTKFSGKEHLLYWQEGKGELAQSDSARVQGLEAWKGWGISASQMGMIPVTLHIAASFDNNSSVITPYSQYNLPAIWCFCSSPEYYEAVRRIDQKLNVTNATLVKVPFDIDHWTKVAAEKYPNGLPKPYADDPTQWIFHGHPCGSVVWDEEKKWTAVGPLRTDATVLQVAVARLLGYRWPAELDPPMELSDESREWVEKAKGLSAHTDDDGIVCLTPLRGEAAAADRLRALLADSFGSEWSADKQNELLAEAGFAGKTLDDYLRDGFFDQHCSLFHQRPFVWHVWDGLREGFHALVNYHMLSAPKGEGRRTLEKLIYTYLGDWIDRQKADQTAGAEGADGRMAAAQSLKRELEKILQGEPPYDIFVRWKPLQSQPIGWEPDINDGVRLNIRPFIFAKALGAKAKNACILRVTPKIKWEKDRGKEPLREKEAFPWFWGCDEESQDFAGGKEFDGNRWNDLHYSRAFKLAARGGGSSK